MHSHIDPDTHTLITTDAGVANLAVIPLLNDGLQVTSASGEQQPELLGWNVRHELNPQYVPATTLLHTRTGTGRQLLFTLLIPLRLGESDPVVHVASGTDGTSAVVTLKDGRRLMISCPNALGISVQETLPDGNPGRSARAKESPKALQRIKRLHRTTNR